MLSTLGQGVRIDTKGLVDNLGINSAEMAIVSRSATASISFGYDRGRREEG
jgi:hypothetical protein